MRALFVSIVLAATVAACATAPMPAAPAFDHSRIDETMPGFIREYNVAGVGIGVIRDGQLVWDGYYGEQGPGEPATARTVFNTASVEKTVTAEVMIALAARGLIDLDEPIVAYVQDTDLKDDPRYRLLTPRILLSHRAGLLNWPYSYDDGRLAFVHEPGQQFSYSGAGVQLAARYAEAKLGRDFEALAAEYVFRPNGVEEMSMGRLRPWMDGRLAIPMDAKGRYDASGKLAPRLTPGEPGPWSGADDLLTTVRAYAAFLTGVMRSDWLTPAQAEARSMVLTSLVGDPIWTCEPTDEVRCATAYGYGIGWMVYDFGDRTVLIHGGNDAGENALVYYSPETRSGAVILVNGGNGIFAAVRALELIGDQPEIAAYYRQLVRKHYGVTLTPAA